MSVIAFKPQTDRRPGPYSRKRTYNPSSSCAPCSGGDWISPEAPTAEVERLRAERLVEIGAAAA